jgi:hypothetical protein
MEFRIPVEPHVYQFLTSPEMFGPKLPIEIRKDSLIGTMLCMLASKGPTQLEDYYQDRLSPVEMDYMQYLVVDTKFPLRKELVPEDNLLYIGNMLSMLFEYQVIFYVQGYMRRNGSERGGIRELYEQFNMQDDPIKQDALRSISKRYRLQIIRNELKGAKQKVDPIRTKGVPFRSKGVPQT